MLDTYNIPGVSQVRVRLHHEPHGNDLQHHFNAEDDEEDIVEGLEQWALLNRRVFRGQGDTVCQDCCENDPVEPRILHNLDDCDAEWVGHSTSAESNGRVRLLLVLELLPIIRNLSDDRS